MGLINYYHVLGLKRDVPLEDIKKQYRKLALAYHPDKSEGNGDLFQAVDQAYKILSNPEKKEIFDREFTAFIERYGETDETYIYYPLDGLASTEVDVLFPSAQDMDVTTQEVLLRGGETLSGEINLTAVMTAIKYPKEYVIEIAQSNPPLASAFLADATMREYLGEVCFYELLLTAYHFSNDMERALLMFYFDRVSTYKQQGDFLEACVNRVQEAYTFIKEKTDFFKKFDVNKLYLLIQVFPDLIPVFFDRVFFSSDYRLIIGFLREKENNFLSLQNYLRLHPNSSSQMEALLTVREWLLESSICEKLRIIGQWARINKPFRIPLELFEIPNDIFGTIKEMGSDLFLKCIRLELFRSELYAVFLICFLNEIKKKTYNSITEIITILDTLLEVQEIRLCTGKGKLISEIMLSPDEKDDLKGFFLKKLKERVKMRFETTTIKQALYYISSIIKEKNLDEAYRMDILSYLFKPFKIETGQSTATSLLAKAVEEISENKEIVSDFRSITEFFATNSSAFKESFESNAELDEHTRKLGEFLFCTKEYSDLDEVKKRINELFLKANIFRIPFILLAENIKRVLKSALTWKSFVNETELKSICDIFELIRAPLDEKSFRGKESISFNDFLFNEEEGKYWHSDRNRALKSVYFLLMPEKTFTDVIIQSGLIYRLKEVLNSSLVMDRKASRSLQNELFNSPNTVLLRLAEKIEDKNDRDNIVGQVEKLFALPAVKEHFWNLEFAISTLLKRSGELVLNEEQILELSTFIYNKNCTSDFFQMLPSAVIEKNPTLIWKLADFLLSLAEEIPRYIRTIVENIRSRAEQEVTCQPHFFFLNDAILFIEKNRKEINGEALKKIREKFGTAIKPTLEKYGLETRLNLTSKIETSLAVKNVKFHVTDQLKDTIGYEDVWSALKKQCNDAVNDEEAVQKLQETLVLRISGIRDIDITRSLTAPINNMKILKGSYAPSAKIWILNAAGAEFNEAYNFILVDLQNKESFFWPLLLDGEHDSLLEKLALDLNFTYWPISSDTPVPLPAKVKRKLFDVSKHIIDTPMETEHFNKLALLCLSLLDGAESNGVYDVILKHLIKNKESFFWSLLLNGQYD